MSWHPRDPADIRFARFVDVKEGCWEWQGCAIRGYGRFRDGRYQFAYRWMWEWITGEAIPDGLTIDHLCFNPACVRFDHLEMVTVRENVLRSDNPTALNARKTHCLNGHPFSGHNLLLRPSGGRDCRICRNEWSRIGREKRKAVARGLS